MRYMALALMAVLSCGMPATGQPENPTTTSPAAKAGVRLISAGAEPLQLLRYSAPVGTVERFELVSKTTQTISKNGKPTDEPTGTTLTYTFTAEVVKSEPEATEFSLEIVRIDVESNADTPDKVNQIKQMYATAKGSKATVILSGLGDLPEIQFKPAPSTQKSAAQVMKTGGRLLGMVLVPFPQEKIGVGGTWMKLRGQSPNEEPARQPEYVYRLKAQAADHYDIEAAMESPLEMPSGREDVQAKMPEMSGQLTYVRGHLLPTIARHTMTMEVTSKDDDEGGTSTTRTLESITSIRRIEEEAAKPKP